MCILNLLVITFVLLEGLSTSRAATCLIGDCGTFCCPTTSISELLAITCCRDSLSCCVPGTERASSSMTCGNLRCPNDLPDEGVYDLAEHIREQCCNHFRSGCCSEEENKTLDLLYKLAIGLGIGLGALVLIVPALICCCLIFKKR